MPCGRDGRRLDGLPREQVLAIQRKPRGRPTATEGGSPIEIPDHYLKECLPMELIGLLVGAVIIGPALCWWLGMFNPIGWMGVRPC